MNKEKVSFGNIKDLLSRDEMKKVVAGSGWQPGDPCTIVCCITTNSGTNCRYVCTWQGCW
jgi:hypothetical protein